MEFKDITLKETHDDCVFIMIVKPSGLIQIDKYDKQAKFQGSSKVESIRELCEAVEATEAKKIINSI